MAAWSERAPGSDGEAVRGQVVLSDGVVPVRLPAPVLGGELDLVTRPTAALCFPAHPLGAVCLYAYARSEFDRIISEGALVPSERDIESLEESLWELALACYLPGDSMRAGFDRLMEKEVRSLRSGAETDPKESARMRRRLFAIHLIVVALGQWADEA